MLLGEISSIPRHTGYLFGNRFRKHWLKSVKGQHLGAGEPGLHGQFQKAVRAQPPPGHLVNLIQDTRRLLARTEGCSTSASASRWGEGDGRPGGSHLLGILKASLLTTLTPQARPGRVTPGCQEGLEVGVGSGLVVRKRGALGLCPSTLRFPTSKHPLLSTH